MLYHKEHAVSAHQSISCQAYAPEDLLVPLNEAEQQHAPATLFVVGSTDMLHHGTRVAIVGSRKASARGLARARRGKSNALLPAACGSTPPGAGGAAGEGRGGEST